MKIHSFIEYETGEFKTVKRFLHLTGHDHINLNDISNHFFEAHTLTVLSAKAEAEELAFRLLKEQGKRPFEGYHCSKQPILYQDVSNISVVNDIAKANKGLSNYLYAFIYPIKYLKYDIYRLDYNISSQERYLGKANYSLKEGRDEVIISINEFSSLQMSYN